MRLVLWYSEKYNEDTVRDITGRPESRHEFGNAEKFGVFDILVSY